MIFEHTKNISIYKFTESNFPDFLLLFQNHAAMKYVTGKALSVKEAKDDFIKLLGINIVDDKLGYFRISYEGQFLGMSKLRLLSPTSSIAELGYIFLPEFWSKGIGSFVVEQMLCLANIESRIRKIRAIIDPENIASRKILIKNGFISKKLCIIGNWPSEILYLNI